MVEKLLFTILLLAAGALIVKAQDYPVSVSDGPSLTVKADTLTGRPQPHSSLMEFSPSPDIRLPSILTPPLFETKEQRAARINALTATGVMRSVQQNLRWYQPPVLSRTEMLMLRFGGLFLTSPYNLPAGCVPLMNASNPFFFLKTPGMAPYEHIYAPDFFPQCVRTEYDFATGTYKQVTVPWQEFNMNMARSYGGPYRNEPVPKMYFNSTERALHQ